MKKLLMLVAVLVAVSLAAPSWAVIDFFGTAKVKPTYYKNFDFDDDATDKLIVNEGGLAKGEHIRAELRLGWKASGEKWSVKMITEADVIMQKDTADRSYYLENGSRGYNPNTGGEFGIERVELLYKFMPQLELQTGWDIRALDIKSGGLLYGDDHPFIGFRGQLAENTSYELLYIPIQNMTGITTTPDAFESDEVNDWRVYSLKVTQKVGGFNIAPFYAYSDNDNREAQINYYGAEVTGKAGIFKPSCEIVFADGEFDNGADISSWAFFAGAEMEVSKAFNPYVAVRYTQGDDDASDDDVEGWVGITDIGRFTPLMGMDGGILSEDIGQSYGATLYSYAPERAVGGNGYGGISNGGSGNNPGQFVAALGAKGDLSAMIDKLSYKTQVFFIWYDETDNLTNNDDPGEDVDDYAGTTFDLQLKYAVEKNFSVDYIFGVFVPGDGLEDQYGDDVAMTNCLSFNWSY
ncbi:hypothetical protein HTZ97_01850 [Desulfuromonas acetoxidans]|uniref:hypothetical protein n=1 Tax=Desulfuromonas acetoxidans TaxID=891 RepID=UPI0015931F5A|nr:hypothetical protein [Desulfuromonas acetoxidans]MBF0644220.1 hypothetical protein [Desulfuromonas acetoxidans]NVD24910.1 hypothetical protein [Desulfuromonas acetoxidans]NVE15211.1 hypothetical protein [Desulfuromonas acetoxidans]